MYRVSRLSTQGVCSPHCEGSDSPSLVAISAVISGASIVKSDPWIKRLTWRKESVGKRGNNNWTCILFGVKRDYQTVGVFSRETYYVGQNGRAVLRQTCRQFFFLIFYLRNSRRGGRFLNRRFKINIKIRKFKKYILLCFFIIRNEKSSADLQKIWEV